MKQHLTIFLALALFGCGEPSIMDTDAGGGSDAGSEPTGLAVLGAGSHSVDAVVLTELAGPDFVSTPRDIAVHTGDPTQLWVVNLTTSVTIIRGVDTAAPVAEEIASLGSNHFLAHPAAIAFGKPGFLATAPEEDEVTQASTPEDFMGPTLWPSDETFDAGHASHMDMLHNSPNSVGIAWERENVYWIFDGAHESLTRYDFVEDHGPGQEDHSDGIVQRFAEGQVSYIPGVSSHLDMDREAGLLYVADAGNNRIAIFDPTSATRAQFIYPNYDGTDQYTMTGGELRTFIDGNVHGMVRPSGIVLGEGVIFVTDNGTSRVLAFDRETGELIDWLDLSSMVFDGGLAGIDLEPSGSLVIVDSVDSRVFRIAARD